MRVLILLSPNPGDGFLVKLHTEELIREVKNSIFMGDNPKAIITALTKGMIEREVCHADAYSIDAGLVLTKERACWHSQAK